MHLPLRRNTKRGSSPPKAAAAPPETSGTPGDAHEQLPHESTPAPTSTTPPSSPPRESVAATQQQQDPATSPHGLKGLGRRMSKPVRMLKTIASRSSMRHPSNGGHGRRPSAMSVHSAGSQQEGEGEHEREHENSVHGVNGVNGHAVGGHEREPGVKEERESVDTDYGKEITRAGGGEEKKVKGEGQQRQGHEDAVRQQLQEQEPVVNVQKTQEELETRAGEVSASAADEAAKARAAVEAHVAPIVADAKDAKHVPIGSDTQPKQATAAEASVTTTVPVPAVPEAEAPLAPGDSVVLVPSQNAETISLSSSSTTVDIPLNKSKAEVKEQVQAKMQQEPQVAKSEADVNPFVVGSPEESHKDAAGSPPAVKSDVSSPVVQSVTLSKELESVPVKEQSAPPTPPAKPTTATATTTADSPKSVSSEDETPELHAPALTATSLFLPVPQTDPLSTLLTKYVPEPHLRPPRDTTGEWQHTDFHTLVMTNNWRALARMARDRIVTASPRDVELILNLWYIRLSSLARLRLFNQTSAECENLFAALYALEPPATRSYVLRVLLPFELEVLRARCAYWGGDHLGYLDDVSALLHRCRVQARRSPRGEAGEAERAMWMERGARMALIVASQLVEMKDYTAATTLLTPLSLSGSYPPSPALRSAIARIHLQGGNLAAAQELFGLVDADPDAEPALKAMNAVVRAAALGDWSGAAESASTLLDGDGSGDVVAANNYAVALLGQGRINEGVQVLEATLQASPSLTTSTEPYLFNLSTMYELRAGLAAHRKRDLLIEVAKWSGDGLRTACLKLNA